MSAIEYQRLILADAVRNDAFARALEAVVQSGKSVVADIGSGTGFLSFLALQYGAKKAFLYEANPEFLALSQKIAKANGIKGATFVPAYSTEVRNPPKADIVISETLGNYALEENILEILRDAKRFLKPGGVVIPQRLEQFACPVVTDRIWQEVASWDRVDFGFDWSAAREVSCNNMYVKTLKPADLLTGGTKRWDEIDFADPKNKSVRKAELTWQASKAQTIYGFALWWACHVYDGMVLSTAPDEAQTHWQQIYLPVLQPLEIKQGDTLTLSLVSDTRLAIRVNLAWEIVHRDARSKEKARMSLNMKNG